MIIDFLMFFSLVLIARNKCVKGKINYVLSMLIPLSDIENIITRFMVINTYEINIENVAVQ